MTEYIEIALEKCQLETAVCNQLIMGGHSYYMTLSTTPRWCCREGSAVTRQPRIPRSGVRPLVGVPQWILY